MDKFSKQDALRQAHFKLTQRFGGPNQRCCDRQAFRAQKTGQRQQSLALFAAASTFLSGADVPSLLLAFLAAPAQTQTRKAVIEGLGIADTTSSFIDNIKHAHEHATSDAHRQHILRIVPSSVSRKQLAEVHNWHVGDAAWRSSRKQPPNTQRLPPNCKPLTANTRQRVQDFFDSNTNPAGNQTSYDKTTRTKVPARTFAVTLKTLHRDYRAQNPNNSVSYSTFCKLRPHYVKQAKRCLDMCEVCVRGKEVEEKLAKRRTCSDVQLSQEEEAHAQRNIDVYLAHKNIATVQNTAQKIEQQQLTPGEVLIIIDFKENLKVSSHGFHCVSIQKLNYLVRQVGSGPVEIGKDFYTKTQVSCLGAAVYCGDWKKPRYYDFLSYSLSHDGVYVRECLNKLIPDIQSSTATPIKK